jgi:hypothetical protein
MQAGVYQNGGDWDWFGARMVQVLVDLERSHCFRSGSSAHPTGSSHPRC